MPYRVVYHAPAGLKAWTSKDYAEPTNSPWKFDVSGRFDGPYSRCPNALAVGVVVVLWVIWKARNQECFANVYLYDLASVITQTAYWIDLWSGHLHFYP